MLPTDLPARILDEPFCLWASFPFYKMGTVISELVASTVTDDTGGDVCAREARIKAASRSLPRRDRAALGKVLTSGPWPPVSPSSSDHL